MTFKALLQSFFATKDARRFRRRYGRNSTTPVAIEMLEPRAMLSATQDVAGLRFSTSGTFVVTGTEIDTTTPVQIGFVPQAGDSFKPLLNLSQGAMIDSTAGQESFTTLGDLSVISGTTSQLVAHGSGLFNINDLLGDGSALGGGIQTFTVGAEQFTPYKLSLTFATGTEDTKDTVANLGGDFNFPSLGNDGFSLDGATSFVTAGIGNKLQATIDSSLDLRSSFTVDGLSFSNPGVFGISYNAATDTLSLNGKSSFQFHGNTFDVAIGTPTAPGLTVANGQINSFDFTSTSDFKIGSGSFKTQSLGAHYVASADTFTIKGTASVTIGANTLSVGLGDNGSAGIVITHGQLSQLGFSTTASLSAGGLKFSANPLVSTYVDATDTFSLTGKASFAFQGNTIQIGFGDNSTPGLVISGGSVSQIGGTINSDVTMGGLALKSDPTNVLTTSYVAATSTFMVSGTTYFTTTGGTKVALKLGGTQAPNGTTSAGLVIVNGSLKSLDAAVTSSFVVSNVTFTANSLGLSYDSAKSQYTVTGGATLAFKPTKGGATSTLNVAFGTPANPGLVIKQGSMSSLNVTANGNVTINGLKLTVTNVNVTYDSSTNTFTARGAANFTTNNVGSTPGTTVNLTLGGKADGVNPTKGLVITDGSVQFLDAPVTANFGVSGVNFSAKSLRFTYDSKSSTFTMTGNASLAFNVTGQSNSIDVTFGSNGQPGIQIVNGGLNSMSLVINSHLKFGGIDFNTQNLNLSYNAPRSTFTVSTGTVSFASRGTNFQITLGALGAQGQPTNGLVIQNGVLTTFDGAITGSFQLSSATFKANQLQFTFLNNNGSTQFLVRGGASMSFQTGKTTANVGVTFGTNTAPGLVFINGSFQSISLIVNSDLSVSSVTFKAKNLLIAYDANQGVFTSSGQLSFSVRGQSMTIQLGQNGTKGLLIRNGALEQLDASVTSTFSFSSVIFTANKLRFQYLNLNGQTSFQLTGGAMVQFKSGGTTSNIAVQFLNPANNGPGLVISNGSFESMALKVQGNVTIAGLTISANNLTFLYDASLSEFIMYGQVGVSTAKSGGKPQVLNNVSVTLGNDFKSPGIEVKNGSLVRLDIGLNGTVNLGPLTATATSLRAVYTASDGNLFITGKLDVTLNNKYHFGVGFPGRGLQINTQTGDVTLNGLQLSLGGITVNIIELTDITLGFTDSGGDVSVSASLTITAGKVLSYSGTATTQFSSGQLTGFTIQLANNRKTPLGTMNLSSGQLFVSGLNGSLNVSGTVHAIIPGAIPGTFLLTADGSLTVKDSVFQIQGNVVIGVANMIQGNATITVNLNDNTFDVTGGFSELGGVLQGGASFKIDMTTGYFNANASLGLFTPSAIPIVGNQNVGSIGVNVTYGPRSQPVTQVILPSSLTVTQPENTLAIGTQNVSIFSKSGDTAESSKLYSFDKSVYLQMQVDGNLVLYRAAGTGNRVIWASNKIGGTSGFFGGIDLTYTYELRIQIDGNLVVYQHQFYRGKELRSVPLWKTDTNRSGLRNIALSVQNDGNLVLYDGDNVIWQTQTKTLQLKDAVAAIAAANIADQQSLTNDFAGRLGLKPATISSLVAQAQVRRGSVQNRFLSLTGHLSALGADFWAHFEDNLDQGGYRIWLDYDPPIFSKGTINIASQGTVAFGGIQIVGSFSVSPSVASSQVPGADVGLVASTTMTPSISAVDTTAPEDVNIDQFLLADSSAPTAKINTVTMNPATNSATVEYQTTSSFEGDVSLFVSTNSHGSDAHQIDPGLLTADGPQRFTWNDVADSLPAGYQAGEKLYFFAVVDDGIHDPVSSNITASGVVPDDNPTISTPGSQSTLIDQQLVFSGKTGNAIKISDPIEAVDINNNITNGSDQLNVVVSSAGHGTLELANLPSDVTVDGNGTEVITIKGTAGEINMALDGLGYTAYPDQSTDTISVQVQRTNTVAIQDLTTQDIPVEIQAFSDSGLSPVSIVHDGSNQSVFSAINIDDLVSNTLNSVSVTINGYQKGKDFLSLDPTGIEDLIAEGAGVAFNANTGVLTVTGGALQESDAQRLLQNIKFSTTDKVTPKRLSLELTDEFQNTGVDTEVLV